MSSAASPPFSLLLLEVEWRLFLQPQVWLPPRPFVLRRLAASRSVSNLPGSWEGCCASWCLASPCTFGLAASSRGIDARCPYAGLHSSRTLLLRDHTVLTVFHIPSRPIGAWRLRGRPRNRSIWLFRCICQSGQVHSSAYRCRPHLGNRILDFVAFATEEESFGKYGTARLLALHRYHLLVDRSAVESFSLYAMTISFIPGSPKQAGAVYSKSLPTCRHYVGKRAAEVVQYPPKYYVSQNIVTITMPSNKAYVVCCLSSVCFAAHSSARGSLRATQHGHRRRRHSRTLNLGNALLATISFCHQNS